MTFRNRIQYFLVKKLGISNKNALELLVSKQIKVNKKTIFSNIEIEISDEVEYNNAILQHAKQLKTYAYYKPKGIETTLNTGIKDNLKDILPFSNDFFPIGRLDKASEGLLLITNNGKIYDKILKKEHGIEKEYIVKVNKPITEDFLYKMANGITIMGKETLPCKITKIDNYEFNIILIQGLNRQIRRMCYKLDYEVLKLVRIRIGDVKIENLKEGMYLEIEKVFGNLQ